MEACGPARRLPGVAPWKNVPQPLTSPNLRTTAHLELESFSPAEFSLQMKNGRAESSCPHAAGTRRLLLHTRTSAARERQQRNGFSGSSLHLFMFILSLRDEKHNGFSFPGCHKPRNILMKNKCIYRETSEQPESKQCAYVGREGFYFIAPPRPSRRSHTERDKYFK